MTAQCLVYLFHIRQKDRLLRFDFSSTKERLTLPMLWSGLPGGSSYFLKFLRPWLMNLMLLNIGGVAALADGTIIATLVSITVILTIGIADPVLPTVAVLFGEKNRRGVSTIQRIAVAYDALLVLPLSVFLFFWPQHFVALFSIDDPQVLAAAPRCIQILVLSLFFNCLNGIVINRCVAVGDPRISLQATVLREFLLVVPFAWLFSQVWQESGVWLAFIVAELVTLGWLVIGKQQLRDLFVRGPDNTEWEVSGRLSVSTLVGWRQDFAACYDLTGGPGYLGSATAGGDGGAVFMLSLSVLRDDHDRRLVLRYDGDHDFPLSGDIRPLISDKAIGLRRRIVVVRKRGEVRREETLNPKAA